MFLVSKLIPLLCFPLGLACFGSLLAAIFGWLGHRRRAIACSLLSFSVLYLGALSPVSRILLRGLESRYLQAETYPKSQAIVILGGAGVPLAPPRLHPETNFFGDRLLYGSLLFHQGLAPRIVVTGGVIRLYTNLQQSEASINARILREYFAVDSADIMLADESWNTREDALGVKRKFAAAGLAPEIILVTSAAHMPRAVALFRKQGFTVHPAPADFHTSRDSEFRLIQLLPEEASLYETWYALHEYLGYAAYRLFGWI